MNNVLIQLHNPIKVHRSYDYNNENSKYSDYGYNSIGIRKNSFKFSPNFMNLKKSVLIIFTIFSIVIPTGVQFQLQTIEAFDESIVDDNISNKRQQGNGNGNSSNNANSKMKEKSVI